MLRYLRIASAAFWGILCALLVVWWVRSYWYEDVAGWRIVGQHAVAAVSWRGRLELSAAGSSDLTNSQAALNAPRFSFRSYPTDAIPLATSWDFGAQTTPFPLVYVYVPHWFLALLSATAAVVPWIRWRFSLRTLLIATTLIAVALGVVIASQ